ncbi:unnamed protein product [Sphagnum troendelagicum]|uniref:Uncharacterized protein n=1 Tax=Sphagnum troendelagicum TaxID=128251 RepID=A0ABP0UQY6_9BRYO
MGPHEHVWQAEVRLLAFAPSIPCPASILTLCFRGKFTRKASRRRVRTRKRRRGGRKGKEEEPEKYQAHFSGLLEEGLEADDLTEM